MKLHYEVGLVFETEEEKNSELATHYKEIAKNFTSPEYHEMYAHLLLKAIRMEWHEADMFQQIQNKRKNRKVKNGNR